MEAGEAAEWLAQNVLVMRHGDRADRRRSPVNDCGRRPWDPPLLDAGKARARETGMGLHGAGFPVHRVVVSPFLRCLQTAAEVVAGLCAVHGSPAQRMDGCDVVASEIKVSIEYGLCEVIGRAGIDPKVAPKDGNWFPDISELESLLPTGTIDHTYESIYKSIPCWEEKQEDAWKRFAEVIQALADKYPRENLLLVTHGQCVAVSVFTYLKNAQISGIKYCAYTHLRRQVRVNPLGLTSPSGNEKSFKLCSQTGVSLTTS